MIGRRWMIPVGVTAILALSGLAGLVGRNVVMSNSPDLSAPAANTSPASTPPASTPPASTPPADFVEFKHEAGFSLSYPGAWKRIQTADQQIPLLAAPDDRNSFQLRVVPLEAAIGEADLAAIKPLTDKVVTSGEGVTPVAGPTQITAGGLPGWHYLYRFTDKATGEVGIHSHYFLFHGKTMITLVFQALPEASFDGLAPAFDQIMATFKVDKEG